MTFGKYERFPLVAVLLFVTTTHAAQLLQVPTYTVNSWKSGSTAVQEQELLFEVTSLHERPLKSIIKDVSGRDKYELTAGDMESASGPAAYQAWFVNLVELGEINATNLLKPNNDPHQDSFRPEDGISLLLYQSFVDHKELPALSVPFRSKRVINVEGFQCIIEIQQLTLSKDGKTVSSATVRVKFVNTKPDRSNGRVNSNQIERNENLVTRFS